MTRRVGGTGQFGYYLKVIKILDDESFCVRITKEEYYALYERSDFAGLTPEQRADFASRPKVRPAGAGMTKTLKA